MKQHWLPPQSRSTLNTKMLHREEWFPEAADFKGLVKSYVVCHAGMLLGGEKNGRVVVVVRDRLLR